MPIVRATTRGRRPRIRPSGARREETGQRRVKISVTMQAGVLEAIDEEARARGTNRSRLIDEVLAAWRTEQRRQALARQYTTPLTPAQQEESAAWDAIHDVAAAEMLADAADR